MPDTQEITDRLEPPRARALHAVLGLEGAAPAEGAPLPPFWHYAYFWDVASAGDLGRDGHRRTGGFIPDLGLSRRMWGGGSLEFKAPLRIGAEAIKTSVISKISHKTGRSGPLALVTLTHSIAQNGRVCVKEQQDLVYRADPTGTVPAPTPAPARQDETHAVAGSFSTTLLFRYSALTFNAHRIHYDRDYCRDVEGYPGLVVHGPLLAQRLIHMAEGLQGPLVSFRFRAAAPLFDFEHAVFCAAPADDGLDLWVRGPDDRLIMTARSGHRSA